MSDETSPTPEDEGFEAIVPQLLGVQHRVVGGILRTTLDRGPLLCERATQGQRRSAHAALRTKVRPGTYKAFALCVQYPPVRSGRPTCLSRLRRPQDDAIPRGKRIAWADPLGEIATGTGRLGFYGASRHPCTAHDAIYDRTSRDRPVHGNLGWGQVEDHIASYTRDYGEA